MKYAYLVASLPTLRLDTQPPFEVKAFDADAVRQLAQIDAGDAAEYPAVMNHRRSVCRSAFGRAWADFDYELRYRVAAVRAGRLGIDPRAHLPLTGTSGNVRARLATVDAFAKSSPRVREHTLDEIRWTVIEDLRRTDPFGLPGVLAFGLQLRLAWRWTRLTPEAGRSTLLQHADTILAGHLDGLGTETL